MPIYQDADAKLADQFNIPNGYQFHGQVVHYPALILLNDKGEEVFRYIGKNNSDRFSFDQLKAKIESTNFYTPQCAIYQNVVAKAVLDKDEIKQNLIDQLTGAVRWTQSVQSMISDGASKFTEVGPGKVLQGLVQKINKEMLVEGVN